MRVGASSLVIWLCLVQATVWSAVLRQTDWSQVSLEQADQFDQSCWTFNTNGVVNIDCSNRGLTELPDGLNYEAQVLDISNNRFENFPKQLEYFMNLEILDASGNHLNALLPYFIADMKHLHTLNLSNNYYDTWIGSGYTNSIKFLDLSRNELSSIDEAAIYETPNIHYLDLSENKLYEISPRVLSGANNLDSLILSRNYFASVPRLQSTSLRNLHLSSCQISKLEADSLAGMSSLLAIDLSINQIERIADSFASNTLQELDLSYNEISTISDRTFSAMPHLAVLNLRGNEFREVWPTSRFASNQYLREVHVKGNRWSCDGFSVNLLVTYEFLSPKVSDSSSLICYSPSNVTQMSWRQAYIETWHQNETVQTFSVSAAVMVGIIIGIVLTSVACRGLMSLSNSDPAPSTPETTVLNLNGTSQSRVESVVMRVPLTEDLPPSYDEALLMPRMNSYHSLPDFVDEEEVHISRGYRRSRSIGDLTESRPRGGDRRSIRRTIEIRIDS